MQVPQIVRFTYHKDSKGDFVANALVYPISVQNKEFVDLLDYIECAIERYFGQKVGYMIEPLHNVSDDEQDLKDLFPSWVLKF
jgi:hypothetical protein